MKNEETNNLLKGILLALVLKEEKRENQIKILKKAGLEQKEIIQIVGPSESTLRWRKHVAKKKKKKK